MREIDPNRRGKIHDYLHSKNVREAFAQNIDNNKHSTGSIYSDNKSDKKDSIKWTLKQIYYEKCAFCESDLTNEYGEIEHYRPKNRSEKESKDCDKGKSYYWLAFSWDNLLPACKRCNGKKSNCFDIDGEYKEYQGERLEDLHLVTQKYNEAEKPKLIHPEYDTFEKDIVFDSKGKMHSDNVRVAYTIRVCDLNRENLVNSREEIVTDFINKLRESYLLFEEYYLKYNDINEAMKHFKLVIKELCKKSQIKYQYSLIRKYIKDNLVGFLKTVESEIGYDDKEFAILIVESAFGEFCLEDN